MTENQKKWWKLAFIVIPVVVAQFGSYAKSRVDAKDDTTASYETLKGGVDALQKNTDLLQKTVNEQNGHIYALEGKVTVLQDLLARAETRLNKIHGQPHVVAGKPVPDPDGDGIPDEPKLPEVKLKPVRFVATPELPADFDAALQQYKAKK
jgi:hypothetical protein